MSFLIWLFVVLLAADVCLADVVHEIEEDSPSRSDLPLARPGVIDAFKDLLEKALVQENEYHRYLLIRSGILPIPSGYVGPKDEYDKPREGTPSPEEIRTLEHFNKHITGILRQLDKLDYAVNRLFGERLFQKRSGDVQDFEHLNLGENLKTTNKFDLIAKTLAKATKEIDKRSGEIVADIDCNEEADSHSEACKVSSPKIPELASLPAEDFVMTSETGQEFVTSASIVDEITAGYVKLFSEMPESLTTQSSHHEMSTSSEINEDSTLTPLDDGFIMHIMSSSIPPNLNEYGSSEEESTHSEKETAQTNDSPSTRDVVPDSEEIPSKYESLFVTPIHGRVLTFEEVKLLDESLSLKPELKYHVISKSKPDQDTLSEVQFFTSDETSSSKPISKKRRRMNPRDISLDEPIFYQAPTPEKMILRYYRDIPDTSFTCENKSLPGFYADQETDCQVFHVCWPGRRESFLCPVGSLFNQQVLSCDNFNKTNCSLSHAYFDVNTAFQEYDDAKAQNVTPSPDPMMKPIQNDSGTTEVVAKKADIVELFEADLHFSELVTKTNITELWDYLPVKAKVFVYPEPTYLKKFLEDQHHHKIRKSKDVRGLESSTETEDSIAGEEILDEVFEKKQKIEANIIRVLKKLSRKHRD